MTENGSLTQLRHGVAILKGPSSRVAAAHRIPERLIRDAIVSISGAREGDMPLEKAIAAIKAYQDGCRVFYLTGPDSPDKELVAVMILFGFLGDGKIVKYYFGPTFDAHDGGFAAVMSVDMAKALAAVKLQAFIRDHVGLGKALVVGGTSLDTIKEAIGASVYDYLTTTAIEVVVPAQPCTIRSI